MPGAQGERDGIVSEMHTCQLGGMSPFDHLTALQMNDPAAAQTTTNQTRRSRHGVKITAAPAPQTLADQTRRLTGRRAFVDAAKLAPLGPLPVEVLGASINSTRWNESPGRRKTRPRSGWHKANSGAWRSWRHCKCAWWRSVANHAGNPTGQGLRLCTGSMEPAGSLFAERGGPPATRLAKLAWQPAHHDTPGELDHQYRFPESTALAVGGKE